MKKLILINILSFAAGLGAFAQSHLKTVQVTSVWAPAAVKIDGRVNEWEDNFQAYNKSTKLFYTLSNNEKYLYLAITSTDPQNNIKIAAGGITLTINTAGKKKDKGAFIITYPVIANTGRGQRGGRFGGRQQSGGDDTAAIAAAHRQFVASSKEIKVFGFKDVDDTLISIYNEYGLKTAIGYDSLGNYNYELAVPLKLLGIAAGSTAEIAYNVKVNGLEISGVWGKVALDGLQSGSLGGNSISISGRGGGVRSDGNGRRSKEGKNIDFEDLTSPTDFWGKYTLAKKQ
jgi:hypothetical protein